MLDVLEKGAYDIRRGAMQLDFLELLDAVPDEGANDAGWGAVQLDFTGAEGRPAEQVGEQCQVGGYAAQLSGAL